MRGSNTVLIVILIVLVGLMCCLCLAVVGAGGIALFRTNSRDITPIIQPFETDVVPTEMPAPGETIEPSETPEPSETAASPETAEPTETPEDATAIPNQPIATPTFMLQVTVEPGQNNAAASMLKTLEQVEVPTSDPIGLTERLKGIPNIPVTETPPAAVFRVGTQQKFWVSNSDTNKNTQVNATLQYVNSHIYFWIEDGVQFDQGALKKLGDTFENKIYPTDRKFFGSEWTPGVDSDVHLYVLMANGLGSNVGGYYSPPDEYDAQVNKFSNTHEMFYLNAEANDLSSSYTYGTLAHEFQHMIHWNRDRNEDTWMNEGFSELAMFINGYDTGGSDALYIQSPDLQLNDWPADQTQSDPYYGSAFLFLNYFLDRFGDKVTQDVVGDPLNGFDSIDDVLAKDKIVDPQSGKTITADDVFADWAVANYLHDPKVGDGRFTYSNYPNAPQAQAGDTFSNCPVKTQSADVHQYGVDYIAFNCQGDFTLKFAGTSQVNVIPIKPNSGSYDFWSNKGDESDMTLDHSFDFTKQTGPITLKYSTWYDIEKDFDYGYLEARVQGGDWKILKTPHSTNTNPTGASFGWAFNGLSNGWVQDQVDLSQFAGKQVDLRFEYITDPEVNGEGFLLDDVSIPEINYQTDFEKDDGGWKANGFVRLENALPQTYKLSLILMGNQTTVQDIPLGPDQTASVPVHLTGDVNSAVLVVSGTTRFTRQTANYQFSLSK